MPIHWGISTNLENALLARSAGWDFVEENVQTWLQGDKPDAEWTGPQRMQTAGVAIGTIPAANCLVPGSLKITGPNADLTKLQAYMTTVTQRAAQVGLKMLVFGSSGARNVPEGFERAQAQAQILTFLRMSAPLAAAQGLTLLIEHLHHPESNIITTLPEAIEYVRAVNHPAVQALADSWHFWLMDSPLEDLRTALPYIKHVHLADKVGRVAPGQSGSSDYRPFFHVLKTGGYTGRISVEAKFTPDLASTAGAVLAYVKQAWAEA
jgi:sugar phosphate isomerase/epimerase